MTELLDPTGEDLNQAVQIGDELCEVDGALKATGQTYKRIRSFVPYSEMLTSKNVPYSV